MKRILLVIFILAATISTVFAAPPLFDTPYIGNSYRHTFHYRDFITLAGTADLKVKI